MTTRLAIGLALSASIAAFAPTADAVNLSSNGLGQVLVYPYYTVNAKQQTLLSVVNTTLVGKVVKVRFREAYNGRSVLDFNLYLSPFDVWTGGVFALADANINSNLAAISTADRSCTDPPLTGSGTLSNGAGYQSFSNRNYTNTTADSGPLSDARTREGHIEIIQMSDITPGTALYLATTHVNGVPSNCTPATLETAAGYAAPTLDPLTEAPGTLADGGLFGSASIIDVANGVFYAYNADALDGFSYTSLFTLPGAAGPTLASVNDRGSAQTATARVFSNGESYTSTFPGTAAGSRAVDAVSAVFASSNIYNEYVVSSDGSTGTDWVLTFPTKHLYVDAQPGGAIAGAAVPFAPFDQLFGDALTGKSCLNPTYSGVDIFDREENTATLTSCGFSTCPPLPPSQGTSCLETNVINFSINNSSSVLGSQLASQNTTIPPIGLGGWVSLNLGYQHQMNPATNGNVFSGVPVTGFAATRYTNDYVPIPGGGLAVGNYSGAYHHRAATVCANGAGACK